MKACEIHDAGAVELYFYDELDRAEASRLEAHLTACSACAEALRELKVIRATLAARPDVSAPLSGDWSGFMRRLDAALAHESAGHVVPFSRRIPVVQRPLVGLLATAALLAVVASSVFLASRAGRSAADPALREETAISKPLPAALAVQAGLTSVGLKHLERSKLVVLGLATKEPEVVSGADWTYERELASALLNDTRLYRLAAEERGLTSLAGVMKDLELVLLQAAMAETTDTSALPQIQRLISKRGLVQKMDVVATTGMLP